MGVLSVKIPPALTEVAADDIVLKPDRQLTCVFDLFIYKDLAIGGEVAIELPYPVEFLIANNITYRVFPYDLSVFVGSQCSVKRLNADQVICDLNCQITCMAQKLAEVAVTLTRKGDSGQNSDREITVVTETHDRDHTPACEPASPPH